MTGPFSSFEWTVGPDTDPADRLHDTAALVGADPTDLLRAVATAGAQIRATVADVADRLARRPDAVPDRARAVLVVGGRAEEDLALAVSAIGGEPVVPVLAAEDVPGWVGPLDAVVVFAGADDDIRAAEAAGTARRRGAWTVVRGAAAGPVADAAGPDLLVPAVPAPEAVAAAGRLALLLAVLGAVGAAPPGAGSPALADAAEQADAVALACHPGTESFVNPAITLADSLLGATPVLVGADRAGSALAGHGARVLAEIAGVAATAVAAPIALRSPAVLVRTASEAQDLFADPFAGDGHDGQPVRAVLLSGGAAGPADRAVAEVITRALPRAVRLPELPPAPVGPDGSAADGRLGAVLAQAVLLDFAAVYLGLALRAAPPVDAPAGLGGHRSIGPWSGRAADRGDDHRDDRWDDRWDDRRDDRHDDEAQERRQ
ncbi:SIS domain-containing protein [Nakamurella leprariae]|uniref:Phosphosugar isomerase n=1 Tax=Nakamurella leprariae TaxID=2803911 RepID=A0A938YH64_9ACTN|nr:SIS domain-containing protein [Nakamurella leprariae]MBM9467735.1 hypothetical protein [Nakamurella leprariae]